MGFSGSSEGGTAALAGLIEAVGSVVEKEFARVEEPSEDVFIDGWRIAFGNEF